MILCFVQAVGCDPETAPQLDRGKFLDQVDGREPQRQRQLGGVEDRARRGGCLLLAPVALVVRPASTQCPRWKPSGQRSRDNAERHCFGAEGFATPRRSTRAPAATLNPIRDLPRQERTKNICLPKRTVTDKQVVY